MANKALTMAYAAMTHGARYCTPAMAATGAKEAETIFT
jgi:hypothetical protein